MGRSSEWYCINEDCRKVLGEVIGGEFFPGDELDGSKMQTRGPNLVVRCPHCETVKVWYTADPLTRALQQLIDVIATQGARRMVSRVSELTLGKK